MLACPFQAGTPRGAVSPAALRGGCQWKRWPRLARGGLRRLLSPSWDSLQAVILMHITQKQTSQQPREGGSVTHFEGKREGLRGEVTRAGGPAHRSASTRKPPNRELSPSGALWLVGGKVGRLTSLQPTCVCPCVIARTSGSGADSSPAPWRLQPARASASQTYRLLTPSLLTSKTLLMIKQQRNLVGLPSA